MADEDSRPKCCALCAKINPIPQRVITALMGCLAIVNAYLMRQCLSVVLPQLVLPRNYSAKQIKNNAVCPADKDFSAKHANKGTFDWNQQMQGIVTGAFYLGYCVMHVPGGFLADKFGSKWVLSLGILSTAIFTVFTPLAIGDGNVWGLIAMRFFMGCGEGTTFPALAVLMADWVPEHERGFLGSLVMGGGQIGSIVSNAVTGVLVLHYKTDIAFYVWGIVGALWFIFFIILCYSSPAKHPCIKDTEKQYILEHCGDTSSKRRSLPPPPFCAIISSCPMWSLIAAQIGHDWAFYILVSYMNKYLNDVLQMRIDRNGIISALPSLVMWICSILSGIIADILIVKEVMSTTNTRKLMTGIAAFGPAIFLVAASYAGCNRALVVAMLCIGMGLMGAYYGGMKLTPIDMSPNYAGFVMAINNGIGSLTGAIAPYTVGFMTTNTTISEWRMVFWVAFVVLVVTGIIYCIFAKSEVQPWNDPETNKKSKGKES